MTGVLCVGIATLDHVFAVGTMPAAAEKYRASDLATVGGGTAASAAFAIGRLGGRAMLATRLGDDVIADAIVRELAEAGVDCSLCRRFHGHRSPLSSIFVDNAGERLVMCYADEAVPADASWLPSRLPDGVAAVLGDVSWREGALGVFALARATGVPSLIDGDRPLADRAFFDAATHVAYSAPTVRALTGRESPAAGLADLAQASSNWIAVTDGARGCWFTGSGIICHEPAFSVQAVDTLGAGDVFHGALALALGEGRPEREAVRFANAAAALKCTRFGGGRVGAPTRAEVEDFLAGGA